ALNRFQPWRGAPTLAVAAADRSLISYQVAQVAASTPHGRQCNSPPLPVWNWQSAFVHDLSEDCAIQEMKPSRFAGGGGNAGLRSSIPLGEARRFFPGPVIRLPDARLQLEMGHIHRGAGCNDNSNFLADKIIDVGVK